MAHIRQSRSDSGLGFQQVLKTARQDAPHVRCNRCPLTYLRLIDFVYHSTLGLRVIKKKIPSHALLASEYGTYKTDIARFWPWLPAKSFKIL